MLPEAEVDAIQRDYPPGCCDCGGVITPEADPHYRHQVWDIPPMKIEVTEHQFHQGACESCGQVHFSHWPDWVPSGQMGAGLIAWIGTLSGDYHLSIRKINRLLMEMCQTTFSTGAISKA